MIPLQQLWTLLGVALGGLLMAGCASPDVRNFKNGGAYAEDCPRANPNDNTPDDAALQTCLDQGGTVILDAGSPGYIIAAGVSLVGDGTVLTSRDTSNRATLIAHPDLHAPILSAKNFSGYRIEAVKFDGNKANRTTPCDPGYRDYGSNLILRGNGFTILNVESSRALCGSAMEIVGSNYVVANSQFYSNGYIDSQRGGWPWSDGMTLAYCQSGYVHDNYLEDSTDIAIVSGGTGGYGCRVENNTIRQINNHAFAGLALAAFDETTLVGDHTNSFYQNNTITSSLNQLDMGLNVGMHGWFTDRDTFGGSVINNTVSGAAINLDIYGYHDGTVNNNTLSNPQGSFAGFGTNYAAAVVANTCMQPGWVVRAVNIVEVSTWDTGEVLSSTCGGGSGTQSLLPGATPSSFSVHTGGQVSHTQEFESSTLTLSSP
jgi:hypothetical protein